MQYKIHKLYKNDKGIVTFTKIYCISINIIAVCLQLKAS